MIDGFGNSQQDSETKIKFAMFGQDHLNKSKRQVGVQPTDIAFQMSFSHTGCPTSTDASDFGRGNTWHLNDGGIELDDERKSIFDKYVESGGSKFSHVLDESTVEWYKILTEGKKHVGCVR